MSWTFCTRNGGLYHHDVLVAYGYSGHGLGRNSPEHEAEARVGPIPRGEWEVLGPPQDTETHGPFVLRLMARVGTDTFGRSGFLIHGESVSNPGNASLGCIVVQRTARELIWESGERELLVVGVPPDDDTTPVVC